MPKGKAVDELLGYFPRRCDRCWYWDEEAEVCRESPPYQVHGRNTNYQGWPEGLWPSTKPDDWCGKFMPRSHGEWDRSETLPIEAKPKKKKSKRKKR